MDRTALRIASSKDWFSAFGKAKRGRGRRAGPPVHDDLCAVADAQGQVRCVLAADAPKEQRLVDITEHGTAEVKLYLCAIKDAFSGRIVGYSIDPRITSRLDVQALENAAEVRCDVAGCINPQRPRISTPKQEVPTLSHPPPNGREHGKSRFQRDNAAMESSFALQNNVLDRRSWTTREQLRIAIVTRIERTYHRRRRQARLGRLTPVALETIMNTTAAPAA